MENYENKMIKINIDYLENQLIKLKMCDIIDPEISREIENINYSLDYLYGELITL